MYKTIFFTLSLILIFEQGYSSCETTTKLENFDYCSGNKSSQYTTIDALEFTPIDDETIKVSGGVCINMEGQLVQTKELFYNDEKQNVLIESPITFSDKNQIITALGATIDLESKNAQMSNVSYLLNQSQANGTAKNLENTKNITRLKELTYSTCPQDNQQWFIQAQSAEIDQENQIGTFRKMKLRFKGVPILYLPYAKMPLNNQRMSGFLIPEVGNSSINGFEYAQPYYLNIKENMDATLIPRYYSKRGAMFGAQFRYLGDNYKGEINAEYLPSDRIAKIDRGLTNFKHSHKLSNHWNFRANLNNVSDDQYFEDFGNNIYTTSLSYLYSLLNLNGYGDNWRLSAKFDDYQIVRDNISLGQQPYRTVPRLEYSWFNSEYNQALSYGIDTQWAQFYREQSITSSRLDVIPYVEKTFQNNYSRFTPRLSYRYTNWDYGHTQFSQTNQLTNTRSLPVATLDYTINFEKQFADGSFNSLEPRLFYLYAPYRNQQNIPLFDTHELTFGTGLLYQSTAFSGADRQSDANQIALGLSQRKFDALGNEIWNFTLGQIAYFDDRRVQLDSSIETRSTSPIITEFNYFYRNWKATMSMHWDDKLSQTERALLKFQRKGNNNSLFNFAYRFRQGKIEQLDTSVVLPIGSNNRLIARWNYSLDANKTIEALAGIEHKNCCWAMRLVGRRYIYNDNGDANNGIFFELQLNGLGAIGRNPRRLLKQSILGYSEEF